MSFLLDGEEEERPRGEKIGSDFAWRKKYKDTTAETAAPSTYGIALTMAWSAGVICTMVAAYWLVGAAVPLPTTRRPWMWDVVVKKKGARMTAHRHGRHEKKRDQVGIGGPQAGLAAS